MKALRELRTKHNISQQKLADKLNVSRSTVAMWENNLSQPDNDKIVAIANLFNVSTDYLLGQEKKSPDISELPNFVPFTQFKQIPILGTIACGEPILAEENIDGYTTVEKEHHADFALRCKGDSMAPKFLDGDLVLVRQQPMVENGQIAAVLIGNEATLKHIYITKHDIMLVADNPQYPPKIFAGEDMNSVRILGLAIGYIRVF